MPSTSQMKWERKLIYIFPGRGRGLFDIPLWPFRPSCPFTPGYPFGPGISAPGSPFRPGKPGNPAVPFIPFKPTDVRDGGTCVLAIYSIYQPLHDPLGYYNRSWTLQFAHHNRNVLIDQSNWMRDTQTAVTQLNSALCRAWSSHVQRLQLNVFHDIRRHICNRYCAETVAKCLMMAYLAVRLVQEDQHLPFLRLLLQSDDLDVQPGQVHPSLLKVHIVWDIWSKQASGCFLKVIIYPQRLTF